MFSCDSERPDSDSFPPISSLPTFLTEIKTRLPVLISQKDRGEDKELSGELLFWVRLVNWTRHRILFEPSGFHCGHTLCTSASFATFSVFWGN